VQNIRPKTLDRKEQLFPLKKRVLEKDLVEQGKGWQLVGSRVKQG
jgi:hypothetical protein